MMLAAPMLPRFITIIAMVLSIWQHCYWNGRMSALSISIAPSDGTADTRSHGGENEKAINVAVPSIVIPKHVTLADKAGDQESLFV